MWFLVFPVVVCGLLKAFLFKLTTVHVYSCTMCLISLHALAENFKFTEMLLINQFVSCFWLYENASLLYSTCVVDLIFTGLTTYLPL